MTLATRCSACGTSFRVVQDQLKVSGGWVRCGRCGEVFNGIAGLYEVAEAAAPAAANAPVSAGIRVSAPPPAALASAEEESAAMRADDDAAAVVANATPSSPSTSGPQERAGAEAVPTVVATGGPAGADVAAAAAAAPAPPASGASVTAPPASGASVTAPPALARARFFDSAEAPHATAAASDAAQAAGAEASTFGDTATRPLTLPPGAADDDQGQPEADAPEAPAAPARSSALWRLRRRRGGDAAAQADARAPAAADDEDDGIAPRARADDDDAPPDSEPFEPMPSFVRAADRAARWKSPRLRAVMGVGVVFFGLLLTAQLAWAWRDALAARWPAVRSPLATACGVLGCAVQPPRTLEALRVDASSLEQVGTGNTYVLSLVLRNRAAHEVLPPAFELTLTDAHGRTLVRRVLSMADLGRPLAVLAAGAEVPGQVGLDLGERRVNGYTVEVFYP